MTCPCDETDFPKLQTIDAGLAALPRALGIFPEWRLAILDSIGRTPALHHWRARGEKDFGVMLVEMIAYLFDSLSFYDALIANNSYLKTSHLPEVTRKLTELLGYIPRPAIAAEVWLAAEAEGKRLVTLPSATGFRSGEFDGNPPQVFEIEQDILLEPRINKLLIERAVIDSITSSTLSSVLVAPNSLRIKKGLPIVLSFNGTLKAVYVSDIRTVSLRSKRPATEIFFSSNVSVPANAKYSELRIYTLGNAMPLWRASNPFNGSKVLLDSRAPVRTGEFVLFENQGELKVRTVNSHDVSDQVVLSGLTSTLVDADGGDAGEITSPDITSKVSELNLSSSLSWSGNDRTKINAYFGISDAARVLIPEKDQLTQTDSIRLRNFHDESRISNVNILMEDALSEGVYTTGSLDSATQTADIDASPEWNKELMSPVHLYGNSIKASRGESVFNELLGVGDATQMWQSFELKKKPLTYLPASNDQGFKSTLEIYVDGVRWQQVNSFFGAKDSDRIYVVRHDEAGASVIEFGGGARLPSGAAIVANYRYGAGAAVPPAGSIIQLAKPVSGLRNVKNILPAFGGGDAESEQDLKAYAPNTGLLLGRTISLVDLEAAAHRVLGVEAVKGVFRWDSQRFEKRAVIYFIGDSQLQTSILASLINMSEPDAAIDVKPALAEDARLQLDLEVDANYVASDVITEVQQVLYRDPKPGVAGGVLHRVTLGPEGVIYFSQIMNAILDVEGVVRINNMTFNEISPSGYGSAPSSEHYFYFGELGTISSGITINGVS